MLLKNGLKAFFFVERQDKIALDKKRCARGKLVGVEKNKRSFDIDFKIRILDLESYISSKIRPSSLNNNI